MVLPEVTTFDEARQIIREQAEEIEKLSNELAWFKRQMFGSKTEHYIPEDNTPSLFPEEESPDTNGLRIPPFASTKTASPRFSSINPVTSTS